MRVTLAGNHIADCGAEGIADTLAALDQIGIAHTGAGMNSRLARARLPGSSDRQLAVALLSYNCVGPEQSWATQTNAGCAYVRVTPREGGADRSRLRRCRDPTRTPSASMAARRQLRPRCRR